MTESITSKTYDVWSKVYDKSFGKLVERRQVRAVQQLHLRPGDRVLDIGVGTGMTLPHYPDHVTVIGMDLSAGMLSEARKKKIEQGMDHCHLVRCDAMRPPFAENSFDHILISHTISVVSDPARLLEWATKLVKPEGRIVVLNHFQSTVPFVAWWEKVLNPLFVKLGWRSDLALEDVLRGSQLKVEYCFKLRALDLWQIVVLTNKATPTRRVEAPLAPPATGKLAME